MNPFSKITEQKLLFTALQNRKSILRDYILVETRPDHFGNPHAREVRERIAHLVKDGRPLGRMDDWFDEPGLSQEARDFLKGAAKKLLLKESKGYTKARIDKLLHNLKLRYRLRLALEGMESAASLLIGRTGETQLDNWCRRIEDALVQVKAGNRKNELLVLGYGQSNKTINALVDRYTAEIPDQYVSLGMPLLDYYYNGASRGNVITLSANSGGGKSAVALNMAINQARAGHKVCYCSMEMDNDENMHRFIANQAEMDHGIVQVQSRGFDKNQKSKIAKAIRKFHKRAKKQKASLTLWDIQDSNFTPQQLELEARPHKYDIIYVDYITLFGANKHTETWKMHLEYSRFLKGMAKRLNCVVVILAQLGDDEQLRYGKAIRDNTDFWFYWTYGEDDIEVGEVEFKTGKARNYKRRALTLNMKRLSQMIITTSSEDLVDPDVIKGGVIYAGVVNKKKKKKGAVVKGKKSKRGKGAVVKDNQGVGFADTVKKKKEEEKKEEADRAKKERAKKRFKQRGSRRTKDIEDR